MGIAVVSLARPAGSARWRAGSSSCRSSQADAGQIVVRVQVKPACCFSWSNVGSDCSLINSRSRCWSRGLNAGFGPPLCGLGARVPASRRLQQPDNERKTDAEPSNDLTLGAFPMINCRRDSLAEVIRAGCHGSLLLFSCPSVGLRFPLHALSPSGGDPGLLNGGRKSVQSREICRRGRFPASPCMVGGCASHSIVPGHHLLE